MDVFFYIPLNKLMDLTKEKTHFDIISCAFPFRVQMTYGDNGIPAHYTVIVVVCMGNIVLAKLTAKYETQDLKGNALKAVSMSVSNSLLSGTVVLSTRVHLHFFC